MVDPLADIRALIARIHTYADDLATLAPPYDIHRVAALRAEANRLVYELERLHA